jgi:DnaK suppressor protein
MSKHFAEKLHQKQTELRANLARLKGQASAEDSDVHTDAGATDQIAAETLLEVSLESTTLEQVDEALARIDSGMYGTCTVCGKPIPDARLEAVPWTPYCIEDQEKLDQQK